MKKLFERIIRLRNPSFSFDHALNTMALIQFVLQQLISISRGTRMILYGRNPKGMMLGAGASFFNVSKVHWGRFLRLGTHVHVSGLARHGVYFGDHVSIGAFSRVTVSTSFNNIGQFIKIGNNVGIGEYSYLGGAGGLAIGDDTIVGQYFSCHPENHNYADEQILIRRQGVTRKGILIGKDCWIGSKVTILDGVQIGDSCIIAAGAVVTQSFPGNSVIGGVPARLIKMKND